MKYIKLFENIDKSGYEEISSDEFYDEYIYEDFIGREYINTHDIDDEPDTYKFIDIMAYYNDINIGKYNRLRGNPSLYIHKSNDEWYYVVVSCVLDNDEKTFKCDQFDGLLNCLKKEFNL